MKTNIIIAVLLITIPGIASAQNYTSTGDGNWTTASKWNNTSGWGTATPPVDGSQGSGTITMNNNMVINSAYDLGSPTLNINASKQLTVNGNMTLGGGTDVNVYGTLIVNGDLTLNGNLKIYPGGTVRVNGSVIVNSSEYLVVGTSAVPGSYADLIIRNDLKQKSSGDVTLNRNARVAVFGNVSDNGGGGTDLKLNQGAEMYVNGNINYTGGGSDIINNNSSNPYGLYVNGSTTNTGGGATTTSNNGTKAQMIATNPTFSSWVSTQQSLMPVTLLFFEAGKSNEQGIVLKWATASEENFDYFVIEFSADGHDFTEIGRVHGNGTTTVRHDYSYEVENPVVGKSYFRLKSVDFDGYTETFKIVSAIYESAKSVNVFPNPVADSKLNIDFNFDPSEVITIVITDLTGNEVLRMTTTEINNQFLLSLEPGFYLTRIQSSEVSSVIRIQVL